MFSWGFAYAAAMRTGHKIGAGAPRGARQVAHANLLMNLVLGLAVSDIEELQRNSAVSRLSQDSCNIMFMENIFVILERIPFFGK